MTLPEAGKIFDDFAAAVGEDTLYDGPASCESSLGYPRDTIIQAIKLWLAFAIRDRHLTEDLRDNIATLVSRLPFFVPDEEARRVNTAERRFTPAECATLPMKERTARAKAFIRVTEWMLNAQTAGLSLRDELSDFITTVEHLDPADSLFWQRVYTLVGLDYPSSERSFQA